MLYLLGDGEANMWLWMTSVFFPKPIDAFGPFLPNSGGNS